MIMSGPTRARTAAQGRSSWPTCTPFAPEAIATSTRSLMITLTCSRMGVMSKLECQQQAALSVAS